MLKKLPKVVCWSLSMAKLFKGLRRILVLSGQAREINWLTS